MFSYKKKKKVRVPYKDNCPACHLFSLEQRSCMGPHSDKAESDLKLCDDYKLDLETFSSLIPRDLKITRWARVKGGYLFEGVPKEAPTENSEELSE
ncbi:MAG TPA: hypothetical protein VFF80_01465 [Bacillota bacterium]|nr:hypothetical protein [Bacillota bacterium]